MASTLREMSPLVESASLPLEWEETNCLACGSDAWTPRLEAADQCPQGAGYRFLVVQCQECGLQFTNPRPTPACIERFYQEDYAPHWKGEDHRHHRRVRRAGSPRDYLPLEGGGRLLDFGCGGGSYLLRMQKQGWQVTGLDSSQGAIDRLRLHQGVQALVGSLPHPELEGARFDVITMWQSLEHVHQPLMVLRAANRLLTEQGQLIVAVPNIASLAFRWFRASWQGLELPRHLTHFTPATLEDMLHRAGFSQVQVQQQRRGGWFRATATLAKRQGYSPAWLAWFAQGRPGSSLLSWYAHLTRQSDCLLAVARK